MLCCSQGCRGYGNPIRIGMGIRFSPVGIPIWRFSTHTIGGYNNSEKSSSEYAVTGVTALSQFVLISIRVSYGNSHRNPVGMG